MKSFILSVIAVATASAAHAAPKFWVNEPEKIVAIAANPVLSVKLVKLGVDDNYFGQLDVSLNYSAKEMDQQVRQILEGYPGYRSQRVVVEKSGPYRYEIPALGISKQVEPKPGVEGPYIEDVIYLNKSQYRTVAAHLAASRPVVQIAGSLVGTVPLMKVIERKELPPSICAKLLGSEGNVGSLISRILSELTLASTNLGIRHPSTLDALLRDIQANCFEVVSSSRIRSFDDLMAVRVRAASLNRPLVGETLQKVYERQDLPLAYETQQSGEE